MPVTKKDGTIISGKKAINEESITVEYMSYEEVCSLIDSTDGVTPWVANTLKTMVWFIEDRCEELVRNLENSKFTYINPITDIFFSTLCPGFWSKNRDESYRYILNKWIDRAIKDAKDKGYSRDKRKEIVSRTLSSFKTCLAERHPFELSNTRDWLCDDLCDGTFTVQDQILTTKIYEEYYFGKIMSLADVINNCKGYQVIVVGKDGTDLGYLDWCGISPQHTWNSWTFIMIDRDGSEILYDQEAHMYNLYIIVNSNLKYNSDPSTIKNIARIIDFDEFRLDGLICPIVDIDGFDMELEFKCFIEDNYKDILSGYMHDVWKDFAYYMENLGVNLLTVNLNKGLCKDMFDSLKERGSEVYVLSSKEPHIGKFVSCQIEPWSLTVQDEIGEERLFNDRMWVYAFIKL